MRHDYNVTEHDFTVKQHDYNVKQHDYTVKRHDYNDKRNDYKYNQSKASQASPKLREIEAKRTIALNFTGSNRERKKLFRSLGSIGNDLFAEDRSPLTASASTLTASTNNLTASIIFLTASIITLMASKRPLKDCL